MKNYLKLMDQSTIGPRYDVPPVFGDIQELSDLLDDLINICAKIEFDLVAAIDALGFILGVGTVLKA
jgi:adenine/guanine phosphoribosyltransferase-like PRPP-binding protein